MVDNGDGTWNYTPALNDDTAVSFSYSITDGTDTVAGSATLDITPVNDIPVATANTVSTTEDTAYTFSAADFTFTDNEGDSLVSATLMNLSLASGTLTHSGGTVVNNGDTLTAVQLDTLIYTPAANATGSPLATFDFTVNDTGAGVVAAQMGVNVTAVNDPPVLGSNNLIITEGATVTLDSSMLSATDVDHPDPSLTFNVTSVIAGYFAFSSDTVTPITSFDQSDITAGTVVFVHNGGEVAPSYSVSVADGTDSTPAVPANITFINQNDAPTVANPISDQVASEDAAFSFIFAANTFADIDVGDTLTYTSDASGWLSFNAATRTFSWHTAER